jgi:dephospho-CoA kinase
MTYQSKLITEAGVKSLPLIISLYGEMGSGKDEAAKVLVDELGFKRLAFGDSLKKHVSQKYWALLEGAQQISLEEYNRVFRRLCQQEGQASRAIYEDVWVSHFDSCLLHEVVINGHKRIVVTDMRQPNEYRYLESLGARFVRVWTSPSKRLERIKQRDGYVPDESILNHETEKHFGRFNWNVLIRNDGSKEELRKNILEFAQSCFVSAAHS